MQFEINQNNLYLLLPSKVSRIADYLALKNNIGVIDAIKCVYSSNTYRRLEQESSKMWHLGPVALYEEFEENN